MFGGQNATKLSRTDKNYFQKSQSAEEEDES